MSSSRAPAGLVLVQPQVPMFFLSLEPWIDGIPVGYREPQQAFDGACLLSVALGKPCEIRLGNTLFVSITAYPQPWDPRTTVVDLAARFPHLNPNHILPPFRDLYRQAVGEIASTSIDAG